MGTAFPVTVDSSKMIVTRLPGRYRNRKKGRRMRRAVGNVWFAVPYYLLFGLHVFGFVVHFVWMALFDKLLGFLMEKVREEWERYGR